VEEKREEASELFSQDPWYLPVAVSSVAHIEQLMREWEEGYHVDSHQRRPTCSSEGASDLTGCNLSMYMYRFEFDINICRQAFNHYDTVAQSSFCFIELFFI
jgi:hypothetical protein